MGLDGRKIDDEHPSPSFALADVIRFSSNIGIVQFASRFSPREQYELLRDFGFGTPTGLPYPAEAAGDARRPADWDKQSPGVARDGVRDHRDAAAARARRTRAIANGGELLQPAIVKEIRAPTARCSTGTSARWCAA